MEIAKQNRLQYNLWNTAESLDLPQTGLVCWLKFNFIVIPRSFMLFVTSFNSIKKHRGLMHLCNTMCENGKCMGSLYKSVKKTRDRYMQVIPMLEKIPYRTKNLILKMYRHSLNEWDNLAEDCLLASDPEIRSLVGRIAAAV